jgi:deoxyhypusine monooxygenase
MQDETAIDYLIEVLANQKEDPMVRHEAGEALGAIGKNTEKVRTVLTQFSTDSYPEVAETCQLAIGRLEWLEKQKLSPEENLSRNPYDSVDPAPPDAKNNVEYLRAKLLNESETMFERYRAMFGLRNNGTNEAILALCDGID